MYLSILQKLGEWKERGGILIGGEGWDDDDDMEWKAFTASFQMFVFF